MPLVVNWSADFGEEEWLCPLADSWNALAAACVLPQGKSGKLRVVYEACSDDCADNPAQASLSDVARASLSDVNTSVMTFVAEEAVRFVPLRPMLDLNRWQRFLNFTFCGRRLRDLLFCFLTVCYLACTLSPIGYEIHNTTEVARTELGDKFIRLRLVSWWLVLVHACVAWLCIALFLSRCPWLLFRTTFVAFESVIIICDSAMLSLALVLNKVGVASEIGVPIGQIWLRIVMPDVFRAVFIWIPSCTLATNVDAAIVPRAVKISFMLLICTLAAYMYVYERFLSAGWSKRQVCYWLWPHGGTKER